MNTAQQTIRTTITLPVDLHEQLRLTAVKKKQSFNDLVLEYLSGKKKPRKILIEEQIKRDFALFDKVAASGIQIDAVKAIREERNRDDA